MKESEKVKDMIAIAFSIILFFIGFTLGSQAKIYGEKLNATTIIIPSSGDIDKFCEAQNMEYGWLSSLSCKEGEVMCHKKWGTLSEDICFKYIP